MLTSLYAYFYTKCVHVRDFILYCILYMCILFAYVQCSVYFCIIVCIILCT